MHDLVTFIGETMSTEPKPLLKNSTPAAGKALIGQFFHSIRKDDGQLEWQGHIIGNPEPGWYLLQLFEWGMGEPNVNRLMRIEDMEHWLFYSDAEAMMASYREGVAREGSSYRRYKPSEAL